MRFQLRVRPAPAAAILLFFAAASAANAQGSAEHSSPRTIQVSGYGSAAGAPDIAVVRIGVEHRSTEVKTALGETKRAMDAVLAAMRAAGVAARDIATVSYDVNFIPGDSSGGPGDRAAGAAAGYRVGDVAAVTVRDLTNLGAVLDAATAAGANSIQGISFDLSDPSKLERQARDAAMSDAHNRAAQLAQLASVKLGMVLSISEAGGEPRTGGPSLRAAAFAGAPPVSPGELSVDVSVRVSYAIQ